MNFCLRLYWLFTDAKMKFFEFSFYTYTSFRNKQSGMSTWPASIIFSTWTKKTHRHKIIAYLTLSFKNDKSPLNEILSIYPSCISILFSLNHSLHRWVGICTYMPVMEYLLRHSDKKCKWIDKMYNFIKFTSRSKNFSVPTFSLRFRLKRFNQMELRKQQNYCWAISLVLFFDKLQYRYNSRNIYLFVWFHKLPKSSRSYIHLFGSKYSIERYFSL